MSDTLSTLLVLNAARVGLYNWKLTKRHLERGGTVDLRV